MSFFDNYARHVSRPYVDFLRRFGMDFEASRASGAVVEDRSGRKYIDCIGGYGNLNVGHNHPHVIEAMVRALEAGRPFGWPFISQAHCQLAERLAELAPGGLDCCLIVNSGAEAVDSALKLARLATGDRASSVVTAHGMDLLWVPSAFRNLKCAGALSRFCRECAAYLTATRARRQKQSLQRLERLSWSRSNPRAGESCHRRAI